MLLPSAVQQEPVIHLSHLHVPISHLKTQRKKRKTKRKKFNYKLKNTRTCAEVQWLRSRLEMQGMWIRSLVWEDCTCRGATKPIRHGYGACAPWSPGSTIRETKEQPLLAATREPARRSRDPVQPKIKKINMFRENKSSNYPA